MTIYFLKGLPGSGKTTYAKKHQEHDPNCIRINKDDLRAMMHAGKHSKGREQQIIDVRDFLINYALESGQNVIIDDTNYHQKHEVKIREIAKEYDAEVKVIDFSDASEEHLQKCIENDLHRLNSVGEKVIRTMRNQYLMPKVEKPEPPEHIVDGDEVIICDIDGTLALFGDANPYDRDFSKDEVNEPVRHILKQYSRAPFPPRIILFSGRKNEHREQTEKWLHDNKIPHDELNMRIEGDIRKDTIVKREMYESQVKGKYNVIFVLDDRNQVVQQWRELGLTCLQVAPGNF